MIIGEKISAVLGYEGFMLNWLKGLFTQNEYKQEDKYFDWGLDDRNNESIKSEVPFKIIMKNYK